MSNITTSIYKTMPKSYPLHDADILHYTNRGLSTLQNSSDVM